MSRLFSIVIGLLAFAHARAHADAPRYLDVRSLAGGEDVAAHASMLEDGSAQLGLEQVRAASSEFRKLDGDVSLGFTRAAIWLRFEARNPSSVAADWILALEYPHLDDVRLYAVRANGRIEVTESGDMREFAQRRLRQPDFGFPLETAAGETVTYYLRVATTGTMKLPLRAYVLSDYLEHQAQRSLVLWMFGGALLVMALYNAAVFLYIRQLEYLSYAVFLVCLWVITFTLSGLTFQYLLPTHPLAANKALAVTLCLGLGSAMKFASHVLARVDGYRRDVRIYAITSTIALVFALFCCFAPVTLGLKVTIVAALFYAIAGGLLLTTQARRNHDQLRLYRMSWYCLMGSVPLTVLSYTAWMPLPGLFAWSAHVGCIMHAVFTSLALAARVKLMGDHLTELNQQLSTNVTDLKHALTRAEEATEQAVRATRVKDDFLATMSHELRTPLNAIINVPQGLLEQFVEVPAALCAHCGSEFVLEEGDRVDPQTLCPDCHRADVLSPGVTTLYRGRAAHTAAFLRKIERSGQHLLRMVDNVLDLSKLEAGRFELVWSELDLAALLREVVDETSSLAEPRGLTVRLELPDSPDTRMGDPLRIKQVVLNLISNAIKFSESKGTITLSWRREADADLVSVRDQGIGIAPADHERVFGSFEQVHKGDTRKYGGTGLGLSISRSLVRMHGGELWLESALGQGATFLFRIPRRKPVLDDTGSTPAAG